jgi:peptide/nickel transport system substrate-binding protein
VELDEFLVSSPAQVHSDPVPSTDFVVLNTQIPPFNDVRVRRAMNLAVDRDRVVQMYGGNSVPTCQQLPPNFPGYEPYCPYTSDSGPEGVWTRPDEKEAKRLVRRSGTQRMSVVFVYPDGPEWPLADYMAELLTDLGYRGSVKQIPPRDWDRIFGGSPRNQFQMTAVQWAADYPAASNFIAPFFACDGPISAGFCDPGIDGMIEEAIGAQTDDEVAAGALWAKVDRAIVRQAPYVWLVNGNAVDFVSQRVGNFQRHPQWTVLLDQLWVR